MQGGDDRRVATGARRAVDRLAPLRNRLARLYWNVRLFALPNPVRDFWMVVVTGLVVWALLLIGQQQKVTCERQNAGADVLRGLVRATRPYVPPRQLGPAFDDALRKLKPRHC